MVSAGGHFETRPINIYALSRIHEGHLSILLKSTVPKREIFSGLKRAKSNPSACLLMHCYHQGQLWMNVMDFSILSTFRKLVKSLIY